MKRALVTIAAALLTFATTSAAFACSLAPEGWFAATDQIRAQPAGPYVVPLDNYYANDTAPVVDIEATDASGAALAGEAELVFVGDGDAFLVWTPATALDPSGQYTATLDFDQEADPGLNIVSLVPVEGLTELATSVVSVGGVELASSATEECCRTETCFTDSCGDPTDGPDCRTCWTTSWRYSIRPRIEVDVTSAQTGRYLLQLEHVADSGERSVLVERLVLSEGPVGLTGVALDSDQDVPFCLEVTATDAVTGESEVIASECAEEADIERADRNRGPESAPDDCKSNTFTEIDETGEERPIDGPGKSSSDGCSAAGGGAASWLLLLVAGFARRRRRAR